MSTQYIKLKKPKDLLHREVTWNKSVAFGTAKTLAQLMLGNRDNATNEFLNTLQGLNLRQQPEELAWELVCRCLLVGIQDLLVENTQLPCKETDNHATHTLAFQITEYLADGVHQIDQDFFTKPNQAEVIIGFAGVLKDWLTSLGVADSDIDNFVNRYSSYVGLAFCRIWQGSGDKYQGLIVSETPADANAEKIRNWQHYRQKLQHMVQTPVFHETISLQQLFIPLRAAYVDDVDGKWKNNASQDERTRERNQHYKVVMLGDYIEGWYNENDKKDAIRLLCGGPGSGKSSSAKIIAARFAKKGERVLFVPLHLLDLDGKFKEAVDDYLEPPDRLGMTVFDQLQREQSTTLLIFDGLDELAMQGKSAEQVAKAFVIWLVKQVDSLNQSQLRVKALVTGRDVVIQQQEWQFSKPEQILHLLPYVIEASDIDRYSNAAGSNADDSTIGELSAIDQRQQWWLNFGKLKGWADTAPDTEAAGIPAGIPTAYTQGKLGEITAQPLLNYLVALHHMNNPHTLAKDSNLNQIYQQLIKDVYVRAWGDGSDSRHPANRFVLAEFEQILQLVAVSAWHGSGRTATEGEIETTFNKFNKQPLLSKFALYKQDASDNKLTQLLTAFYFKRVGTDTADNTHNNTFEFTHKSFEEYLVAKQMASFVTNLPKIMGNNDVISMSAEDVLLKWVALTGQTQLNHYYFDFFVNEMKLYRKEILTDTNKDTPKNTNKETLTHIQGLLIELVNHMLQHDLPMHKSALSSYQQCKQHARHAKDALLACLGCIAGITKTRAGFKFTSPTDFANLLAEIGLQRQDYDGNKNPVAFAYLTHLTLSKQVFISADLYQVNFADSDLSRANLYGADLTEANLRGANLTGANLRWVKLTRADLYGADLTEANLRGADLYGADLTEANLRGANLTRADLYGADLYGADLTEANLRGVKNLHLAKNIDLTGAIID